MRSRILGAVILTLLGMPLLLVGFWGTRVDEPFREEVRALVAWIGGRGLEFVTYGVVDFAANILWFSPFAALAVVVFGRRWWPLVLAGGAAVSVAIELGQAYLLPARVGTPTDVLANVLGTGIGIAVGVLIRALVDRPRRAVTA